MKTKTLWLNRFLASTLCLLPLALSGCAKSDSTAIATSEISPTYVVEGQGGRIRCEATFNVGNALGTYVELSGEDHVSCSDGETISPMVKESKLINQVHYVGGSDLRYEVGRTYSIILTRSRERHVAKVALPPELFVTSPVPNEFHRKGKPLTVSWTPAANTEVQVTLSWGEGSSATGSVGHSGPDQGRSEFSARETETRGPSGSLVGGDLPARITAVRLQTGSRATSLKGGDIVGKQSQTVVFTLVD